MAIIHTTKKYHCHFCGAEIFWSDLPAMISTIPVNADESHHFCNAYAMLRAERRKEPIRTFFGK
jgi:hypothetical protein